MNEPTATNNDLLKEFPIEIPHQDVELELSNDLIHMAETVQLKGFRKGKVPLAHIRRMFAPRALGEVVERIFNRQRDAVIAEYQLQLAMPARLKIDSDESGTIDRDLVTGLLERGENLKFTVVCELLPDLSSITFDALELERPKATVQDIEIRSYIEDLRTRTQGYHDKEMNEPARQGDQVVGNLDVRVYGRIDVRRRLENSRFFVGQDPKGDAENPIGNALIDQSAGTQVDVKLTADEMIQFLGFTRENLDAAPKTGNPAECGVVIDIKQILAPDESKSDSELAVSVGLKSFTELESAARKTLQEEADQLSKSILRRRLLDKLDTLYRFPVPPSLELQEFSNIWQQYLKGQGAEIKELTEKEQEEIREEYRAIANRRVRLGLLLANVSKLNNIQVPDSEVQNQLIQEARNYPREEMKYYEYFKNNPKIYASVQAPLLEQKTLDFIANRSTIHNYDLTVDELRAVELQDEQARISESEQREQDIVADTVNKSEVIENNDEVET